MGNLRFQDRSCNDPDPAYSLLDPRWLCALVVLGLLGWRLAVAVRGRKRELPYWVWALISFGPVSQIFPFLYPVADWDMGLQSVGIYAGIVLPIAALYLFMRRTTVDRTMFISSLADYFALALIFGIAVTGLLMKYYVRPFMVDVKGFAYGLVTFNFSTVPVEPVFLIHITLVLMLLVYFPFSKLMHAGGLLFSPTRHQCDNPREKRHINPWSPNLSS